MVFVDAHLGRGWAVGRVSAPLTEGSHFNDNRLLESLLPCAARWGWRCARCPAWPEPIDWFKDVKFSGYVEAGGIGNSAQPNNNLNWGYLFTDRDNEILMNQLSFIAEPGRPMQEAI